MEEELKLAFSPETEDGTAKQSEGDFTLDKSKRKGRQKLVAIVVFVIGLALLATGVTFLILKLTAEPKISDAEYLISVGKWRLEDGTNCAKKASEAESENGEKVAEGNQEENVVEAGEANCSPSVVWNFTEAGKGTLTTNNHLNDYDFIWTIEGETLKIETSWLYTLNDEFSYKIDRETNTLILQKNEESFTFVKL